MATSMVRQNYHTDCEDAINKQINIELYASYTYQSMFAYFDREDVALKGFAKFAKKSAEEETEHAQKLMKYQNKRGGKVVLQPIDKPERDAWGTGLDAMESSLALEKEVNHCLLDLHKVAAKHEDAHLTNFIEEVFLEEQVESIKTIADYIKNLKRVGPGLGEYMFDKETLDD